MPDDALPADATLQLSVSDLDDIFADVRPIGTDVDSDLEGAHVVGQIDAAIAMHQQIIDEADVLIE